MSLAKKRGRPKSPAPVHPATPELLAKTRLNLTMEVVDILRNKDLITKDQHRAGIHLRWLHSLKFGNLSLQSSQIGMVGRSIRIDNERWRASCELDYHNLVSVLKKAGVYNAVANVCIFNQRPAFLLPYQHHNDNRLALSYDLEDIRYGLDLIIKFVVKQKRAKNGI
jgi:enamine deaminase RidA (YjgF/YER057c/UK114 family)